MKPLILTWISLVLAAQYLPAAEPTPEEMVAGFDKRVDGVFRAEACRPLQRAKKPPLGPGRGNYVRGYSYSMVRFTERCFFLGEMLDEVNTALVENAGHYLDHPLDINGEPVNYAPPKVLESPFLKSDYNSGVVEIRSGTRKKVLDFNKQN